MRLKTWQAYLVKQSNSLIWGGLSVLLFSFPSHSSGLFENFKALIKIQKENAQVKKDSIKKTVDLATIKDRESITIDTDYLSEIIFNTNRSYLELGLNDQCSLYDLIQANLLKSAEGEIKEIFVRYKSNSGVSQKAKTSTVNFLRNVAYKRCPKLANMALAFQVQNIAKALRSYKVTPPSSKDQCLVEIDKMIADVRTPYLCSVINEIGHIQKYQNDLTLLKPDQFKEKQRYTVLLNNAKTFKELLNPGLQNYLRLTCQNFDQKEKFCLSYFQTSYWQKAAIGEKRKTPLKAYCKALLKKDKISKRELEICASRLATAGDFCLNGIDSENALSPALNCAQTSYLLNNSTLYKDYLDCPGSVANQGIVNISRLIHHITKSVVRDENSCLTTASLAFAKLSEEASDGSLWKEKLCYLDRIKSEEICYPVIFGHALDSSFSVTTVMEKILSRTKGLNPNEKCKLVSKRRYNPALSEYRSGCVLVLDEDNCSAHKCDFKTYLNQREIDIAKVKADDSFYYYPVRFTQKSSSAASILARYYEKKEKQIRNISLLKKVMKDHPEAVFHGVACMEDIYPEHFSKITINQCSPLPFIFDGLIEKNGLYAVNMKTAMDSLAAPKIVPWSHLFSALMDYQRKHPLNTWGLSAIY